MMCVFLFLRIIPAKIGLFKFLLEGHDGLALLTTVEKETGLVRLAVPRSRYTELIHLVDNLAHELNSKY